MTPNFALDLSEDGIVLLHRDTPEDPWNPVSEVDLDAPDLSDRLKELRQIATDLAGEDFRTEVILPPSQLLYATLKVDSDAAQEVPRALEELTPYRIDEIRYDIDESGEDVRVVAVARETLTEAEDFVGPYGLNMVRFTARPSPDNFGGPPDLGPTRFAAELAPAADPIPQDVEAEEPALAQTAFQETVTEDVTAPPEPARVPEVAESALASATGFTTNRRYSSGDPLEEVGKTVARVQPRIAVPTMPAAKPSAPKPKKPSPAMRASSAPKTTPKPAKPTQPLASKDKLAEPIKGFATPVTQTSPVVLRLVAALFIFLLAGLVTAYSSGWLDAFLVTRQENSVSLEEALASAPADAPELSEVAPLDLDATTPEAGAPVDVVQETAPALPEPLTESEAENAYVLTGIWQRSPELGLAVSPGTLDNLYIASLDPGLAFEDAPALQAYATDEGGIIDALLPPPPSDTVFDLGPDGLVRPTPDGALNADGIRIFEGPPSKVTGPRPGSAPVQAEPEANTRLAGIRPAPRPSGLSEANERSTFGGLTRNELAAIRPAVRPESAQSRAEAIARALAEASTEGQADQGTRFAVASSVTPRARPSNIDQIVARAVREAPDRSNPAAAASTAAIGATGPAVARNSRARPSGTTRASVARAATDNNALSLGRVALVGVFGPTSNRRALVRMPNGRFKKVSVGDRIDGGRVAAIGEGALRYTKGSRTVTLEMPRS